MAFVISVHRVGDKVNVAKKDQGDRSLIFFSKKFVNSHNKLYLCVFV